MSITGLTGAPIHKGSWLGLPDIGLTEILQGTKSTTPAQAQGGIGPVPTPNPPQGVSYTPQLPGSTIQFPTSSLTSSPSNQVNTQNQQTQTNNNPSGNSGGLPPVDMSFYQGWNDPNAIQANWRETYQQKLGQSNVSDEVRRRENETRNAIESGYGEFENRLRGLQSQYGASRDESLGSASKVYDQLFGGLSEQKQSNLDKLQAGKQEVQARQASSIKDLQSNLSNVLRGASMQFGAIGAGDTSATRVMLPYAYTKMAGAQEGDIRKQANQQQFEIEQEARDTESKFSEMWRQTEVDKETQLQSIRDYYSNAIQNVQYALAQAPANKAQALASLNQSLLQEAMSNLRQLEAEDRQSKENLKNWATSRMSELNNLKLQLAGSANFSPQDIVWNEMSVQGGNSGQNGQGMDFTDYVTATRKKYLGE